MWWVKLKLKIWMLLSASFNWHPIKHPRQLRQFLEKAKVVMLSEKEVMYMLQGSIRTLIKDKNYFYHSSVGSNYCHLTEDGRRAVLDMVELIAPKLHEAMHQEDVERSKQLVLKELKGD